MCVCVCVCACVCVCVYLAPKVLALARNLTAACLFLRLILWSGDLLQVAPETVLPLPAGVLLNEGWFLARG